MLNISLSHFANNNLISSSQFAYLNKHSTQTVVHHVTDECLSNIDKGLINLICCLDLSKGFDVLNHDILLYKLSKYNISLESMTWFKSYLTNRSQLVRIGQNISTLKPITTGVPQGTVLGPIFFLIYINDLDSSIIDALLVKYADDATIVCTSNTVEQAQTKLTNCLNSVSNWFNENRLIVNASKSNLLPISTLHKIKNIHSEIDICMNNVKLQNCDTVKVLGVYIDETLSFNHHIDYLTKKISPKIGLLHRLCYILPKKALNSVYLATIQPLFDYGLTVWGNSTKKNLMAIQCLQNRAARAVCGNFDYLNSSVTKLITDLGWMTIQQRLNYFTCILVYKSLNDLAPNYLSNCFQYVSQSQPYVTRSVRDGPFDIRGGGWDFSSRRVIFFSLFAQQVIFSKVNCNKIFIFLGKNTLKSEKCKGKQHIE